MFVADLPLLRLLVLLVTVVSVGGCSRHESPPGGDRPLDQALKRSVDFICDLNGTISVRFLGPETVELSSSGETQVLNRMPAASGARYVGGQTEFWNKGDEVMLVFGDARDSCRLESA
jgi:membrane-bound inhibitor of C-type lysozyme